MAKKKNRPNTLPAPTSTAVVTQSAVTGLATPPSRPTVASGTAATATGERPFLSTPAGRFFRRLFKIFSSLQLAISLLSLFALCMITATLIESWHSPAMAEQLVYHAWWFTVLLLVLGINIVCAALKKMDPEKLAAGRWPWKGYQSGFLITHVGLITLVFGGLLTTLGGTDGQIQMIDVKETRQLLGMDESQLSRPLPDVTGYENQTSTLRFSNLQKIVVTRVPVQESNIRQASEDIAQATAGKLPERDFEKRGGQQWVHEITPGNLAWHQTDSFQSNDPRMLRILYGLSSPIRGASYSLDQGELTVSNFFPWAESWNYEPAQGTTPRTPPFPGVELRLESKLFAPTDLWVTGVASELPADPKLQGEALGDHLERHGLNTRHLRQRNGKLIRPPMGFDFMTAVDADQVKEFLEPPASSEMGSLGQLVLFVGKERQRFPLRLGPEIIDKPQPLGNTGLTFTLRRTGNLTDELTFSSPETREAFQSSDLRAEMGEYPFVRFDLTGPEAEADFWACSRLPNLPLSRGKKRFATPVVAFYHSPDGLQGRREVQGVVEFLRGPDGKTYFRSISAQGNLCDVGEPIDLADQLTKQALPWRAAIRTTFQSIGYLPQAVRGRMVQPRNLGRAGATPPQERADLRSTYLPAIVGSLRINGKDHPYQVRLGESAKIFAEKNHEVYVVHYRQAAHKLPFAVTLHRTWDEKDPGTDRSGKFHSKFTIHWDEQGVKMGKDAEVFMNHTVDFGGYRFFQANFEQTDFDCDDPDMGMVRRANVSGITLSRDPGLWFKYGGTLIVVLGIVTMFYMKAYFFKPRVQREPKPPAGSGGLSQPA